MVSLIAVEAKCQQFLEHVEIWSPVLQVMRSWRRNSLMADFSRLGPVLAPGRATIRKRRLKIAGCPVYFWSHDQVEDCLRGAGFKLTTSEVYGQLFCVESVPI